MNKTLVGLVDVIYIIYFNNILIYLANLEEHYIYVKLYIANLYAKLLKCKFN
jgi:hypothetical protein